MELIPIHNIDSQLPVKDIEVQRWLNDSRYDISMPHRHNYFEILVFKKGGGYHEIDFARHEIKSNSLHFIAPNQVHVVKRGAASEGYSVIFTETLLDNNKGLRQFSFFKPNAFPVLNLSKADFVKLKTLLDDIRAEYFLKQHNQRELLGLLLNTLLIQAQRVYDATMVQQPINAIANNDFTTKIQQLIEQNYKLHWRAHNYADALNMSVAHLSTLCKQHFSKSTETLIKERVLLEIKRLLVYTDKTVKEICFELQFDDPAYFNRFFLINTKLTPLEYRKSVRK